MIDTIYSQPEFSSIINDPENRTTPIIIRYFTIWCRPCQVSANKFYKMSKDFENFALFYEVDVDLRHNVEISQSQRIKNVPTFQVWKGGEKKCEVIGMHLNKVAEGIRRNLWVTLKFVTISCGRQRLSRCQGYVLNIKKVTYYIMSKLLLFANEIVTVE